MLWSETVVYNILNSLQGYSYLNLSHNHITYPNAITLFEATFMPHNIRSTNMIKYMNKLENWHGGNRKLKL